MREIKFRAWINDCDTKKPHAMYFDLESISQGSIMARDSEWHRMVDLRDTTEQYTGLKDNNGKEIYEGDIVESKIHNPSRMSIHFIEGGFCADWGRKDYPLDINHFYNSKGCCIQVIGNIHENPELL